LVVYVVLAMCLFSGRSYEEVRSTPRAAEPSALAIGVAGSDHCRDLADAVSARSGAAADAVQQGAHRDPQGRPPGRVIEYTLAGDDPVYRLLTTIPDPQMAPADELAPHAEC
jgi:hypothetical protein